MEQLLSTHFNFLSEISGDTLYAEYTDNNGNTFIYEDGELKDICLASGTYIHIYTDGEVEVTTNP